MNNERISDIERRLQTFLIDREWQEDYLLTGNIDYRLDVLLSMEFDVHRKFESLAEFIHWLKMKLEKMDREPAIFTAEAIESDLYEYIYGNEDADK